MGVGLMNMPDPETNNVLLAIFFFGFFGPAGSSRAETIDAVSCNQSDVQSTIHEAASGDTVNVPAGSCVWGNGEEVIISGNYAYPSINIDKALTLMGHSTIISGTDEGYFIVFSPADFSQNPPLRITGFTFDGSGARAGIFFTYSSSDSTIQDGIRVDHNVFRNMNGQSIWINGQRGVIDNNSFLNVPYPFRFASGNSEDWWNSWEGIVFGEENNNMYVEDNIFEIGEIVTDCQYGNRYAFRYNTITVSAATYPMFDMHGNQGTGYMWACFGGEIYGNEIHMVEGQLLDQRAGKTVVHHNAAIGATGSAWAVKVREEVWDTYNPSTNVQPQHVSDSYYWNNREDFNGSLLESYLSENICASSIDDDVPTCSDAEHGYSINENDEWFQDSPSFDGTSGIGCGPPAGRPATCSPGVGYWATDQSCTDLTGMVGAHPENPIAGTLYRCVAADTWEAYYTPYFYPHPMRAGDPGITRPSAPSGLVVS
jgi:hypothetical protein